MTPPARLVPEIALPAYTYVPGQAPHPFSDPAGHRFGGDLPAAETFDPTQPGRSVHYLLGIDLFNHGYFWEAHELWEKLWHAAGRRGTTATFLKALIQLAVVGVKALEGRADGARTHADRAAELFREVTSDCKATTFAGLDLSELIATAESKPLNLTLDWKSS